MFYLALESQRSNELRFRNTVTCLSLSELLAYCPLPRLAGITAMETDPQEIVRCIAKLYTKPWRTAVGYGK